MEEYQFPSGFPLQHRYATYAGEYYRNQLGSTVQGHEILVEKPNQYVGTQLMMCHSRPAPPPEQNSGFLSKAMGLYNQVTSKMDGVANIVSRKVIDYTNSNSTLKAVEDTLYNGLSMAGNQIDNVVNKIEERKK